jgi:hypothetical protein
MKICCVQEFEKNAFKNKRKRRAKLAKSWYLPFKTGNTCTEKMAKKRLRNLRKQRTTWSLHFKSGNIPVEKTDQKMPSSPRQQFDRSRKRVNFLNWHFFAVLDLNDKRFWRINPCVSRSASLETKRICWMQTKTSRTKSLMLRLEISQKMRCHFFD